MTEDKSNHDLNEGDTVKFRKNGIKKGVVETLYRDNAPADLMVTYEGRSATISTMVDFSDIIEVDFDD